MAAALGIGYLPMPMAGELYGTSLFLAYPLSLGVLDPAFSVPAAVVAGKLIYAAIGAALLCFAVMHRWTRRKQGKSCILSLLI